MLFLSCRSGSDGSSRSSGNSGGGGGGTIELSIIFDVVGEG